MAWRFDETAFAGREHLDPAYVDAYDLKAGFDPSSEIALLRQHGLDEHGTLVDLGAGTGTLALAAAPNCRRVVAVDVSPAMVEAVRRKVQALGAENVEAVQAGFLSYEHHGAPADAVYSRNALHHLPDLWKAVALDRIARVLRPRGVLLLRDIVFDFDPSESSRWIDEWLAGAAGRPGVGWTRAELETHLREEHSTFTWLLEPMLRRAGFEIRSVGHRKRVYADYVCVRR